MTGRTLVLISVVVEYEIGILSDLSIDGFRRFGSVGELCSDGSKVEFLSVS